MADAIRPGSALEYGNLRMAVWSVHASRCQSHGLVQAVLALKRRKTSDYRLFFYTRRSLAWPLLHAIRFMQHILTKHMLIGIEVGIEYMLGLTYSPHVSHLYTSTEQNARLQDSVQSCFHLSIPLIHSLHPTFLSVHN